MTDARNRRRHLIGGSSLAVAILGGLGCPPPPIDTVDGPPTVVLPVPGLREFQPDISRGGRAVAVDVSPDDPNTALVASEIGGIFRTADGGVRWTHVDGFPPSPVADLHFAASPNAAVVIATTGSDGWIDAAENAAGIWRSTDSGRTWAHMRLPAACGTGIVAAWGIGFRANTNDVYVGTDCGLVASGDLGATWSAVLRAGGVRSVSPHAQSLIDICTTTGHFRSSDSGVTWSLPAPGSLPRPDCASAHALAVSPLEDGVLFATAGATVLESDDAGATWSDLMGAAYNERPRWVRAGPPRGTAFDLYFPGQRQACGAAGPGLRCSTTWARVPASSLNHDLAGVAFPGGGNCPAFMVGDFGIVSGDPSGATTCSDGSTWRLIGSDAGFSALQVYQVIGQVNSQGGYTNLYLATQDNLIWANNGARRSGWVALAGSEGVALDTPHAALQTDPRFLGVTGVRCSPCDSFYVPRTAAGGFGTLQGWPTQNPPGNTLPPALVEPQVYVQQGGNDLHLTTDMGASWTKVATLALARWSYLQVAGPAANPTVYLAVSKPGNIVRLAKVSGFRSPTGSAQPGTVIDCIGAGCVPAHGSGLVNLHAMCFAIPCLSAFGVDPGNADHIIAADSGAQNMKVSRNGGDLWTVDDQLTAAVTMNGRLRLESQPLAIYFDRANPSRILVGTQHAGIIASVDGGDTWTTIVDSPKLTAITSFFVDTRANYAYVATYSRGLWRLNLDRANYTVQLTYVGATSSSTILPVTLAARFVNTSRAPSLPIANARIRFDIGNTGAGCDAMTDGTGLARCNARVFASRGTYTLTARFDGDAQYAAAVATANFRKQ